jgi:hypothetical protein
MPEEENNQNGGADKSEKRENPNKKIPEKVLFNWEAPARPFKTRGREYWVSIISIAAVLGFIFFIIEGIMPVILIISLVFLFYVLSTVKPEDINYKLTNKGVKIEEKLTRWRNINRFWFGKRFDSSLLVLEIFTLPGRLELVINENDRKTIEEKLSEYVEHEQSPASGVEKAANWFSEKLPGN